MRKALCAVLILAGCGGAPRDQAAIGAELYETRCAVCHDRSGTIGVFIDEAIVRSYKSAQALFNYTRFAMPYDAPRSLRDDEYWAITSHMLRSRGLLPDDMDLGPENAADIEWSVTDAAIGAGGPRLRDFGCSSEVGARLASWKATGEGLTTPPGPGSTGGVRIPTDEIGVWVLVDLGSDGLPTLSLLSPEGIERLSFATDCTVTTAESEGFPLRTSPSNGSTGPGPDGFTDADLRASILSGGATVVYVWSPHMPLSVDGYAEIAAASDGLGLTLVPVLFSGGDRGFAEREAARGGIPSDGLREVESIELILRDAHVHAPTVLVFDGTRVSPVLPGYRNADGYRDFLASFLEGSLPAGS